MRRVKSHTCLIQAVRLYIAVELLGREAVALAALG